MYLHKSMSYNLIYPGVNTTFFPFPPPFLLFFVASSPVVALWYRDHTLSAFTGFLAFGGGANRFEV